MDSTEEFFESLPNLLVEDDFVNGTQKVNNAKNELFSNLKVCIQAEPYNPADCNAIGVSAEDVKSKIVDNDKMTKVGYIRVIGTQFCEKRFQTNLRSLRNCKGLTITRKHLLLCKLKYSPHLGRETPISACFFRKIIKISFYHTDFGIL